MALPLRCKNPPESFPVATVLLIALNVVAYMVTVDRTLAPRESVVEDWSAVSGHFSLLRGLTAMFIHGGPVHLLGNMWFLALFGFAVEGRLRWYRFVPLYLLAGYGGDVLQSLLSRPGVHGYGASGAIMGVVGAALWMFPHAKVVVLSRWNRWFGGEIENWFFPIADWPLWVVALFYLGFDLLYAALGARDGVGHFAHLGGALVGLVVCMAFRPTRDSATASESKATLAEVKDLAVLSRMELAELHLGNPNDDLITLHWMDKSLRDPKGPNQACLDAFLKALPRMRRTMDPRVLAAPMLGLFPQGVVKARDLVSLAGDLERAADNHAALRVYETAYGAPDATDAEQETACFRTGLILENTVHDRERAAACYGEVLHRWPMGSFGAQAKARLAGLQARAKV